MIRHIVWWTLMDNADSRSLRENLDHLEKSAQILKTLPSVKSVEVSSKILPSSTVEAQFALMSTHESMEDLETYRVDPIHKKFAEKITTMSASRNCLDYFLD